MRNMNVVVSDVNYGQTRKVEKRQMRDNQWLIKWNANRERRKRKRDEWKEEMAKRKFYSNGKLRCYTMVTSQARRACQLVSLLSFCPKIFSLCSRLFRVCLGSFASRSHDAYFAESAGFVSDTISAWIRPLITHRHPDNVSQHFTWKFYGLLKIGSLIIYNKVRTLLYSYKRLCFHFFALDLQFRVYLRFISYFCKSLKFA